MLYISISAATWNQYDGVLHKKPKKNSVANRIGNYIFGKEYKQLVSENEIALVEFLPTWSGFCKGRTCGKLQSAQETVDQILWVYYCMKAHLLDKNGGHNDIQQMATVRFHYYVSLLCDILITYM